MIYDPLLSSSVPTTQAAEPVGSTIVDNAAPAVTIDELRQIVTVVDDQVTVVSVVEPTAVVITGNDSAQVTIVEDHPVVVVDDDQVVVLSVGLQGPPGAPGATGAQGPAGPPGASGTSALTPVAPIAIDLNANTIGLAPGTTSGQGLIWGGSVWQNQQIIPVGTNGTIPFKQGSGFSGDDTTLKYNTVTQTLAVAKVEAILDGGNF